MLKNIQNRLLLHSPIAWNVKIVPMLLIGLSTTLLFFIVGYLITDNTPQYDDSIFNGFYYLLIATAYLVATLFLIFWLIRYNRNNGIRTFYPYTNTQLYLEWLFIFAVCIVIGLIPSAMSWGKATKWQQATSKAEQKKAIDLLHKVLVLLPDEDYNYLPAGDQTLILVGDAEVDRTKFDTKLYNYEEDALGPENPIEYVGPSFLYYSANGRGKYWAYDADAVATVHSWLVNQQQDSIRGIMEAFLELQKKSKFKSNLNAEHWMSVVYNPPLYPVKSHIQTSETTYREYQSSKYTNFRALHSYYDEIGRNQKNNDVFFYPLLIIACVAMAFSVLIFSARLTSGKQWIFAMLSVGILFFIYSLLVGLISLIDISDAIPLTLSIFWLALFGVIVTALSLKIANNQQKGKSNIYLNIGLWIIPAIIPLLYSLIMPILQAINEMAGSETSVDNTIGISFTYISIINLIVVTAVMYPVSILLRRWKALPED